jgi:hypothetical protein
LSVLLDGFLDVPFDFVDSFASLRGIDITTAGEVQGRSGHGVCLGEKLSEKFVVVETLFVVSDSVEHGDFHVFHS